MSIGRNTYRTPYIRSRRDRPIACLQATDDNDEGNPSVAINHSEDCQTNSIIFNIKQITRIKPKIRRATTITLSPNHQGHVQLPCIIELQPISLSHTHSLEVVPALNQLHKTGDTEIMIVNDTEHEITIPINAPIATANIDDILELNHPDTNIEEIKITHQPTNEEITTMKQPKIAPNTSRS